MQMSDLLTENLETSSKGEFMNSLRTYMKSRGQFLSKIPVFDHKELDLFLLYKAVTSRGGLKNVIKNKAWKQITTELQVDPERTDAGFRLRIHYLKYLSGYERKHFFGLEDEEDSEIFVKAGSKRKAFPETEQIQRKKRKVSPKKSYEESYDFDTSESEDSEELEMKFFGKKKNYNSNKEKQNWIHNNNNNTNTPERSSEDDQEREMSDSFESEASNSYENENFTFFENQKRIDEDEDEEEEEFDFGKKLKKNNYNDNRFRYLKQERFSMMKNQKQKKQKKNDTFCLFNPSGMSSVNFSLLEISTLKKYNEFHKLKIEPNAPKKILLNAVDNHFSRIQCKI